MLPRISEGVSGSWNFAFPIFSCAYETTLPFTCRPAFVSAHGTGLLGLPSPPVLSSTYFRADIVSAPAFRSNFFPLEVVSCVLNLSLFSLQTCPRICWASHPLGHVGSAQTLSWDPCLAFAKPLPCLLWATWCYFSFLVPSFPFDVLASCLGGC